MIIVDYSVGDVCNVGQTVEFSQENRGPITHF